MLELIIMWKSSSGGKKIEPNLSDVFTAKS